MPNSARFIANRAAYHFLPKEIDTLLEKLSAAIEAKHELT